MEIEFIEWITENAPGSVPYLIVLVWSHMALIGRKVAKIDKRMTKVEAKQELHQSGMYHREGQLSK